MLDELSHEERDNAFRSAIEDAERNSQYYEYILTRLEKLPLLNLWDQCFWVAIAMFYSYEIPDCVQGLDWKALEQAYEIDIGEHTEIDIDENTLLLLLPLQQWLSDQISKSIKDKEITPVLIGKFLDDGRIDPKRTYLEAETIENWLQCRGIGNAMDEFEFMANEINDSIGRIHGIFMREAAFLSAKTYNPAIKISKIIIEENYGDVFIENWKLRGLLNRQSSASPSKRSSHGNAERFARNREQILGAAIHVIIHWPEQCRNSSGKFEATKIAAMIDSKSFLFWPESGEPPLNRQKMEREISKWINSNVK